MTDTVVEVPARPAPVVEPRRGRGVLKILLEVALISLGVLLALWADQLREDAAHRTLARQTLERVRTEFVKNREAVAGVVGTHEKSLERIQAWLAASPSQRARLAYPFTGTSPAFLEYTAWDLAIATQALGYIDADLAQEIAHVYAVQKQLDGATSDITQVMYSKTGGDVSSFLQSMGVYFGDCLLIEPRLVGLYDRILPRLDQAIGAKAS